MLSFPYAEGDLPQKLVRGCNCPVSLLLPRQNKKSTEKFSAKVWGSRKVAVPLHAGGDLPCPVSDSVSGFCPGTDQVRESMCHVPSARGTAAVSLSAFPGTARFASEQSAQHNCSFPTSLPYLVHVVPSWEEDGTPQRPG